MNVSLTPELETIVNSYVESGQYATASEVMREAIRTFDREKTLYYFRSEIQKGIDDIEAGRYTSLKTPEEVHAFFENIKKEGRRRLAEKRRETK
jgi:antitoxin ParD1/3/4